jgi:two-component system, NtrC family, sensor kinase
MFGKRHPVIKNAGDAMDVSESQETGLRLGIVGGGKRCLMLLDMFEKGQFQNFKGAVVAVADINPEAPGMVKARKMGLVTTDFDGLVNRKDIDLFMELTGLDSVRQALLQRSPSNLSRKLLSINNLFYDLLRVQAKELEIEDELEETASFLQTMIDAVEENFMVIDPHYRILDVNKAMVRNIGLPIEEIIGSRCYQITHRSVRPCESPDHPCPLQQVIATGEPTKVSHKHYTREGKKYYEVAHYPLLDKSGKVTMILEMARDISEIVNTRVQKTKERLKQDYSRLVMEDKMISLGKLMASCVHEINNPLSGTLNLARLVASNLNDGIVTDEQRLENLEYLQLIISEIDRTSKIVSNLLFFSRQQPKEEQWINVDRVMDRVLAIAHHKISLQQINLVRQYAPDIPEIRFQAGQLDQTFMNLIFNSIEAMPNGGDLRVAMDYDSLSEKIVVSIKDSGYGIKKEDMLKIFEPFFSTKGEAKGVGLGLSVVYGIIRAHNGTIDFVSEPGQGTECIIKLPIQLDLSVKPDKSRDK